MEAGLETMARVEAHVSQFPDLLRSAAEALLSRHGYSSDADPSGPHTNVLGQPLMQLPIWVEAASGEVLDAEVIGDIQESSLCGYLAVRAEDDLIDGPDADPGPAMMLAAALRARHLSLLARHTSDSRFWSRVEVLWQEYADAMLLEKELNKPTSVYRPDDFDLVLLRSQPLEIPADAVLTLNDRWDDMPLIARLVHHLAKATQIFDDFVDAPEDLGMGNHTLMVRRLSGTKGEKVLRRKMLEICDEVIAEAAAELDGAVEVSADLGLDGLVEWVNSRKEEMAALSERTFRALFQKLASSSPPDASASA